MSVCLFSISDIVIIAGKSKVKLREPLPHMINSLLEVCDQIDVFSVLIQNGNHSFLQFVALLCVAALLEDSSKTDLQLYR